MPLHRLRDYALATPALLVMIVVLVAGHLGVFALVLGLAYGALRYQRTWWVQPIAADLVIRHEMRDAQRAVERLSAQAGITAPTCLPSDAAFYEGVRKVP